MLPCSCEVVGSIGLAFWCSDVLVPLLVLVLAGDSRLTGTQEISDRGIRVAGMMVQYIHVPPCHTVTSRNRSINFSLFYPMLNLFSATHGDSQA